MKLFRVIGSQGEILFQERVPDNVPALHMSWEKPIKFELQRIEIITRELPEELKKQ